MLRVALYVLFTTVALATSPARGATCGPGASPFDDVPDSTFFCTNTLWLRNANVTVGCEAELYCPDEFVLRSQMALFMNRLAKALTPEIYFDSDSAVSGDLDTDVHACTTNTYTLNDANQHHLGAVVGNLSILANVDADIALTLEMQKGGGSFFALSTPTMALHVPGGKWTMASIQSSNSIQLGAGSLSLLPNESFAFRITLRRLSGSSTSGELTGMRCQLKAEILRHWNQN